MRYVRFNFIDETFGEEVECLLIWDDEEFIIVTLDEEGHINGAILIPEYELKRDADKFLTNKEEVIVVYCSTGTRSKKAQKELKEKGYKNVYNLYNGLEI